MKNILAITLFTLASIACAVAQQPDSAPDRSSGQTAPGSSQAPGASQSQPSAPDSRGQASNAPITEGCLGGTNPRYTITDKTGTTYKLNIPPNADASKLASHVGESVQVLGDVKDPGTAGNASINVQSIGRGTGNCPNSGSGTQSPKQ